MDQNDFAVTEQVQNGKMNNYDADTDTDTGMEDTGIHDSYDNDAERSPNLFTGYPQKGALYTPGALNGLWTGRMVVRVVSLFPSSHPIFHSLTFFVLFQSLKLSLSVYTGLPY